MRTINLDELDTLCHTVTKRGVSYLVRPVTARVATMIAAAEVAPNGEAKMLGYYNAAALLLPAMPREEVEDLTPAQVLAVIDLAGEQVRVVEEAAAPAPDPKAESSAPASPVAEPSPASPAALGSTST